MVIGLGVRVMVMVMVGVRVIDRSPVSPSRRTSKVPQQGGSLPSSEKLALEKETLSLLAQVETRGMTPFFMYAHMISEIPWSYT